MKIATGISISLLLLAALVEWTVDQNSASHIIAEKYIGECEAVKFPGVDAFQAADKTAIIFESEGFHGPIVALIVISNNEIEKLVILRSNGGLDRSALNDPGFLKSFQQNVEDLPLDVDAVSGATISSQIVIDEMNRIIKEWNTKDG